MCPLFVIENRVEFGQPLIMDYQSTNHSSVPNPNHSHPFTHNPLHPTPATNPTDFDDETPCLLQNPSNLPSCSYRFGGMFTRIVHVSRQGVVSLAGVIRGSCERSRANRLSHVSGYGVVRFFSASLPEHIDVTMPALSPV